MLIIVCGILLNINDKYSVFINSNDLHSGIAGIGNRNLTPTLMWIVCNILMYGTSEQVRENYVHKHLSQQPLTIVIKFINTLFLQQLRKHFRLQLLTLKKIRKLWKLNYKWKSNMTLEILSIDLLSVCKMCEQRYKLSSRALHQMAYILHWIAFWFTSQIGSSISFTNAKGKQNKLRKSLYHRES